VANCCKPFIRQDLLLRSNPFRRRIPRRRDANPNTIARADRTRHTHKETAMAERTRTRRNTLERRCLGKAYKRLFVGSTKGVFKMLEKIKKA